MSEYRKQGYKCAKLHHKGRTSHWQDVMDASKHKVMSFCWDALHMPVSDAEM